MVLKGMSEKDEVERILILIINGIKRKTGKFYWITFFFIIGGYR